jgi:hypothetical protein
MIAPRSYDAYWRILWDADADEEREALFDQLMIEFMAEQQRMPSRDELQTMAGQLDELMVTLVKFAAAWDRQHEAEIWAKAQQMIRGQA